MLHPNLNPPFFSALLAPLTLFSYGRRLAVVLGSAGGRDRRGTAGGIHDADRPNACPAHPRLPRRVAGLFPTWASVVYGQVSLYLLLALVLVWRWTRNGHDGAAGLVLGVAAGVKLFVALPVLYFLLRRRWRLTACAAVAGVATLVIGLIAAGPDAYRSYFASAGSVTWYAASWNASLMGFFTRFLGGSENVPLVEAPWLAHGLAYGLSLAMVAGLAWLAWPRPGQSAAVGELGYGLALALMLLISPLGWMYYFPAQLPALLIAWRWAGSRRARVLCVAAVLLASAPSSLVPSEELNERGHVHQVRGLPLRAVLLAGVLTAELLHKKTKGDDGWLTH